MVPRDLAGTVFRGAQHRGALLVFVSSPGTRQPGSSQLPGLHRAGDFSVRDVSRVCRKEGSAAVAGLLYTNPRFSACTLRSSWDLLGTASSIWIILYRHFISGVSEQLSGAGGAEWNRACADFVPVSGLLFLPANNVRRSDQSLQQSRAGIRGGAAGNSKSARRAACPGRHDQIQVPWYLVCAAGLF